MTFYEALKFQARLLLAIMAVVLGVTATTIYVAEKTQRSSHQRMLETQFQNQVRAFLSVEEARAGVIKDKCRGLARSVRLRAALQERDVEDLYQNALTELKDIMGQGALALRASFFRFFDAEGKILSAPDNASGLTESSQLDESLAALGGMLVQVNEQSSGYIALADGGPTTGLRNVVLTRIIGWDGETLGTLVLGFPISGLQDSADDAGGVMRSGLWLNRRLHIDGLSPADRQLVVQGLRAFTPKSATDHLTLELEAGPHLVFYKLLDPETQLTPAYQVCLYPLAASFHEQQILRWKIIGLGLVILFGGFCASLVIAKHLSRPVEKIVAGSVENLNRRRKAESDLEATNRELEKALHELKATQQQVIQQERLSAIGQMASGIAHDFNNTLTPIVGFADLLLENDRILSDKKEARRCLEMLRTSAKDAASVVSRLREFYRPASTDEEFPVVDLIKVVQQAVALTEPKWKNQAQARGVTVTITTNFQARPFIAGEEAALREVLTNLIFNAVDAMPEGGEIAIEISEEEEKAVLLVRDSGTGMSESVRQRCLEPFFSTKGDGGTGLGLSMVYGIVERHRGQLQIESIINQGTTFIIRLPLAESAPMAAASLGVATSGSSVRVLLVDDESRILGAVATLLRADGHSVSTAASGREALEKFRRNHFDLVLIDRVMPEMSGDQTARFMKQIKPDVPVVMLTGFGGFIEATGSQPEAIDVVLSKPITISTLRQTIGQVLHAA